MSELFVRLFRVADAKENFFTECLAATLDEDTYLARCLLTFLCGEEVDGVAVAGSALDIDTQVSYPGTGSCVDMVFRLGGQKSVGIEHKLFSPEGRDSSGEKAQLEKYLNLPILDRLAFITAYDASVKATVLASPRYLRPQSRQHFMWSDLYETVEASTRRPSARVLNRALLGLFSHLGFEPPPADIGDLSDPDLAVGRSNRRNFAKLWGSTRQMLDARGYQVLQPTRQAGLDVGPKPEASTPIELLWLDPEHQRGSLRVRLTAPAAHLSAIEQRLRSPGFLHYEDISTRMANAARRKSGRDVKIRVLDVMISMRKLFGGADSAEAKSQCLADFTSAVLDALG
jgi:hypothetical protein